MPNHVQRPRQFRCPLLLAVLAAVASSASAAEGPPRLRKYTTRHYTLDTNLAPTEAVLFGRHMDTVFDQYAKRFRGFRSRSNEPMSLYLFATQQEYLLFLHGHGINASNTGGIFFVQPNIRGLATWTKGKPRSRTVAILQHEGFHQFAFDRLGPDLPIWANEGLAQYFEDGILVGKRLVVGLRNGRRIERVKAAILDGSTIDLDEMLHMTAEQWQRTLVSDSEGATLLYDQAWSMAYYMVARHKARQEAFARYLKKISKGRDSADAFQQEFGQDTAAFRKGWQKFALTVQPDAINTAVERLEFLGQGLQTLLKHGGKMPRSLSALQSILKRFQFRLEVASHGTRIRYSAKDPDNFRFERPDGTREKFVLSPSTDRSLPPRITAPGLNPSPTLVWFRDTDGDLVQDIAYK